MDPRAIDHARVEAKRLLKRTQDPRFTLPTTLGAAQDVVATLKGFPHWHALVASSARPAQPPSHPSSSRTPIERPLLPADQICIDRSCWVASRPGAGKSLFFALQVLAQSLQRLHDLPRLGVIDIGPSAGGWVDALRDRLPPSQKAQVRYIAVDATTVINPFDTPLGLTHPIGRDRRAKIRWVAGLLGQPQRPLPWPMAEGLLDLLYNVVSPHHRDSAQRYQPETDPVVDAWLAQTPVNSVHESPMLWWDVVQHALLQQRPDVARRAQHHAAPTLQRLSEVLPLWLEQHPDRNTVQEALNRFRGTWTDGVTNVAWDDARMVVLDLNAVCRMGNDLTEHLAGVHHLAARVTLGIQAGAVDPDEIAGLPSGYGGPLMDTRVHDWHRDQTERSPLSWTVYDEWHRFDRFPGTNGQLIDDLTAPHRRVWLLTQRDEALDLLDDQNRRLRDRFERGYLLDVTPRDLPGLQRWLEAERPEVQQALLGTVRTTFRAFRHQLMVQRQESAWSGTLQNRDRPDATTLWSLSTTSEDVRLRQALTATLGHTTGLRVLARLFPTGTCRAHLDQRRRAMIGMDQDGNGWGRAFEQLLDDVWRAGINGEDLETSSNG